MQCLFVKGERIKKIQKKRKIQTLTEKNNPILLCPINSSLKREYFVSIIHTNPKL